ncbi:polysaccharide biosynthesis protein, partial [Klebsiella pneumoniae]|uniref:polysaccharide biosynthesis protein n=1 Tax=Klebsiella pneumoniae TaxID=573 RepID=UPI0027322120
GATKRAAELVVSHMAGRGSGTKFLAVRFGNVLGSSGSVIPKFKAQIANGGPMTVTHAEMTRYFMTIPEAARLVIQAGAL